ncbi:MAG: inorganic pyrophosphatase [Candidatus Phytoplasma cynodontis]|uniref:inorganic diphosphatase n=1 Tax='Cynodon dactylon' phytoplasma TaxID=295320 RepID=UPI001265AE58|nr:inorganic diphosphatase ['Cynodon dactylon' phytoplasma]KAB8121738.1 inorganic diphosphatase ['Cynodon dactylon' phytoplasma]WIA07768.1 MAG: inorganic pyrophosphatase [Candidatus Phytoplasma cynodontis]
MKFLQNINSCRINEDKFLVFIEISKGSQNKYELDKETGLLILDRFLSTSFKYPANYGFIPFTYCDDKDPLDVFVLSKEILDPMILVECRPIGLIKMIDNNELDEKIIAVPIKDVFMNSYQDINDIPSSFLLELKHFLMHYKDLEDKKVIIEKIENKKKAFLTIKKSLLNYNKIDNKKIE